MLCHTLKIVQDCFEEHDKEFQAAVPMLFWQLSSLIATVKINGSLYVQNVYLFSSGFQMFQQLLENAWKREYK